MDLQPYRLPRDPECLCYATPSASIYFLLQPLKLPTSNDMKATLSSQQILQLYSNRKRGRTQVVNVPFPCKECVTPTFRILAMY